MKYETILIIILIIINNMILKWDTKATLEGMEILLNNVKTEMEEKIEK